ncbi:acetyltransferase [Ramlibacter humi]|uniref:Acetyltransferase n=1 Tax=Ramlibacter humi TaxID=2530451 RepID=A0A4Z0BZW5_9BURK|nr:acetyltransferase [Ramlibacter humi]TFZ03820.1 acetyltransferase [Ramlibacter humi]
MKQPLVIFGTGDIAELASFYFDRDSPYEVAAFTVDGEYVKEPNFQGRPVVAFEEAARTFAPEQHAFFAALSYSKLNEVRKTKYLAGKALGYRVASYVSSRATVLNDHRIGEHAFILEDNTLQPFCSIGDNVTLWSGNHIGHHSRISDHCFLASHIVVSGGVEVGESSFIGVNVTIRDHVKVGARCVLGAGALVLADCEPEGVYSPLATERSRVPSTRLRRL